MWRRCGHGYGTSPGSAAAASQASRPLLGASRLSMGCTCTRPTNAVSDHASRLLPEDDPYLNSFKTMDMDERLVNRSPETMRETFHWFRGEGFGLIIEDLLGLPSDTGVIAEGLRLLPHLVRPPRARPKRAHLTAALHAALRPGARCMGRSIAALIHLDRR